MPAQVKRYNIKAPALVSYVSRNKANPYAALADLSVPPYTPWSAVRSKGGLDENGASSFGSADSDIDSSIGVKELQLFPMAVPAGGEACNPSSPSWPPVAAPIAGWTTPGSVHSKPTVGIGSPPQSEAFPLSDVEASPLRLVGPSSPAVSQRASR